MFDSYRADYALTEKLLKEKEQVISELLEEGEKLSKQQLNSNNIIKKLRAKEKEFETSNKSLKYVYCFCLFSLPSTLVDVQPRDRIASRCTPAGW